MKPLREWLHSSPLRSLKTRYGLKLLGSFALPWFAVACFVLLYFPSQQKSDILTQAREEVQTLDQMLAFSVGEGLTEGNLMLVQKAFEWSKHDSNVVFISILDETNGTIFQYNPRGAARDASSLAIHPGVFADGDGLTAVTPIISAGKKIGSIVLFYSLVPANSEINRRQYLSILASVLVFICGFWGVLLLAAQTHRLANEVEERTLAEKVLVESEERYRNLFESNPTPLWVFDTQSLAFLAVNVAAIRHYGYSREEFLAMAISDIRPAADIPLLLDEMGQNMGDLRDRGDWRHAKKDGTIIDVETISHKLSFNGRSARLVLSTDTTERRMAERAVLESEKKYRSIFQNAVEGIYQSTPGGRFLEANPALVNMLGYASSADLLNSISDIRTQIYRDPADRDAIDREMEENGLVQGLEARFRKKDGSDLWVAINGRAVRDAAGNIVFYEGTIENIEERKKLEAQIFRVQRLESIGTLASGIAHDLNNVLGPIVMAIELLRGRTGGRENEEILSTLEASANRGAGIVKQVLTFARGGEGKKTLVDVQDLVNEVKSMIRETFPRSISINTGSHIAIGKINGNATQLHQVILNLCVNARDAMPEGGKLTLSAEEAVVDKFASRTKPDRKQGNYIVITVEDTGKGIAPDVLQRIFDPFFTTKEFGKGTGLGLASALGIVKAHGGFIDVSSEANKGTRFMVYLPVAHTGDSPDLLEQEPTFHRGNGELILIVDDEQPIRDITQATLETFGYRVLTACDGQEGYAKFMHQREGISLILTDLMMPNVDGIKLIHAIRAIDPLLNIVTASGLIEKVDLEAIDGLNVQGSLSKPFAADTLLQMVHDVLARTPHFDPAIEPATALE